MLHTQRQRKTSSIILKGIYCYTPDWNCNRTVDYVLRTRICC